MNNQLKSPHLIYGIAIQDAGYLTMSKEIVDGKVTYVRTCPFYTCWHSMISRVLKPHKGAVNVYKGATVYEEWLRFSNFRAWMEQQDWEGKQLDKDLLVDGNKHYSPDTCLFVTPEVNFFIRETYKDLPLGVFRTPIGNFMSRITVGGAVRYLGTYKTPEEASVAYLREKYEIACEIAARQTCEVTAKALVVRYSNKLSLALDKLSSKEGV